MSDVSVLADHLQSRIGEQVAIELSNPRTPGASAVDAIVLHAACADAMGRFAAEVGVAFDVGIPAHLAVGGDLALFFLHSRAGNLDMAERYFAFAKPALDALKQRAAATARTNSRIGIDDGQRRRTHDFPNAMWHGYRDQSVGNTTDDNG